MSWGLTGKVLGSVSSAPALMGPSLAWSFHWATIHPSSVREPAPNPAEPRRQSLVALPPPRVLDASLQAAMDRRASCRRFSGEALSLQEVSTLLDAGYGGRGTVTVAGLDFERRPVPSAGARYPLTIHLIAWSVTDLDHGTYRYVPCSHSLERTGEETTPERVCELFLGQPYLAGAGATAVVAATLGPSLSRYGDRGYRYVLFEAGHVAQNLNLAGAALGLGSLNLGGFYDRPLSANLRLGEDVPLYGVALGRSSTADPSEARQPPTGGS